MIIGTLEEFNNKKRKDFEEMQVFCQPHPNGIECPECGEELWDSDPMTTLTSNPPQKNIYCPACGYKGYRLA